MQVSMSEVKFFYMEDDGGSGVTSTVDKEIKDGIRKLVTHLRTRHAAKVEKVYCYVLATNTKINLPSF